MVLIPNIGRVANPLVKPALGVSQTGVLAYQTGSGGTPGEVTWFDHDGKNLGKISSLNPVRLRFSPDGNLLGSIQDGDIWVTDLTRGTSSRLTRDGQNIGLAWSPDGRRLATLRSGSPTNKIVAVSLDGSGEQVLLDRPGQPTSWDTGHLAFNGEGGQLFVTSVDGKQAPLPVSLPNSQSGQLSGAERSSWNPCPRKKVACKSPTATAETRHGAVMEGNFSLPIQMAT
jgi:Tol biopolymer transport system component